MTNLIWTHDAVFEAMQERAEPARVPLVAAYQVAEKIRTDYQHEVDYLQGTVTTLGNERDNLRADLEEAGQTAWALTTERNDALRKITELEAQITQLNKTIFRLTHPADVYLEVGSTHTGISHFRTGMQDVDIGLRTGNPINRTRLAAVCDVMATHVMNFGAPDLWPKQSDSGITNWTRLDERMNMFVEMGVEPMLVLYNYPWWMKELVLKDSTVPMPSGNPFSTDGRVRRDMYAYLYEYCYDIALRYMAAPYNVRWFVYGNELKGFFFRRDGRKGLDFEEYTEQYNVFVGAVLIAARQLNIDTATLYLGGPYAALRTVAVPSVETVPVGHILSKAYGHHKYSPLEAIEYWLQHADRKDFIAFDMGSGNAEGGELVETFTIQATKYADVAQWLRTLTDLPMVITEVYPKTADDSNANAQRVCAAKTVAHLSMIEAGYTMAWQWGAIGQGEYSNTNGGMLKDYTDATPNPWYEIYRAIGECFGAGARLYPVTVDGTGIYARASDKATIVVNMTSDTRTVCVGETVYTLAPYDVLIIEEL